MVLTALSHCQKVPFVDAVYSFFTGKVKYVSGKGSFFNVKCHHSSSMALKPWRSIASRSIMRLWNCSAVMRSLGLYLPVLGLPPKSG